MKRFEYMRRILLAGIAGVACIPMFSGCSRGEDEITPDAGRQVTFSISIPGNSAPDTRALGALEESEVGTIEMLLFDPDDHTVVGNPVFANDISTAPGNVNQKTFSVRLPEGTFDVMIFANARDAFAAAGTIAPGDDRDATLAKLKADMPALGWPVNPADANKEYLIPMWGMKDNLTVGSGAANISGVYLHRMVARIDLIVSGDNEFTGDFKLREIKLYNVQTQGRIAPELAKWNAAGMINGTTPAGLATAPSTVAGYGVHPAINYTSAISADEKSCEAGMYIFEAPKATAHADQNAPFMTVRGEFDGVEGWYRIDLANYSNMTYIDVLRNHRYSILIKRVSGTGFPNEEDAKTNRGDNIIVDITIWNEYSLGGTVFDGQHYLSISPQDMEFSMYAHTGASLTIKTDENEDEDLDDIMVSGSPTDPNVPLAGDWIDTSLSWNGVVNGHNVYTLTFDVAENDTGTDRTGYIYVKYGRLTNVVRVRQLSIDLAAVVGISISGTDEVAAVGGNSGTIEMTGVPAAIAPQMYLKMACATISGSSLPDGRQLVHHAAQLIDEDGNMYDPNAHYAVNTQFHVRFPKLYFPNREIPDISAIVTFTLSDGTTKACTIKQTPLTAKNMTAWSMTRGAVYGNLVTGSYNTYLLSQLNQIPTFSASGGLLNNYTTSIPAGTNYLHASLNDGYPIGTFTWSLANQWRTANPNGLFVVNADGPGGENLINITDSNPDLISPFKVSPAYPDVIYDGTTNNYGMIRQTSTKVYKFIMEHAGKVLAAGDVVTFYGDDVHTSMPITGLPVSAVPLIEYVNSSYASLVIDPERNLMYMGETEHFNTLTNVTQNRDKFTQNMVKYMEYAAQYGTHFTNLLIEDGRPNAQPAPWDSYWGANAIP